MLVPMDMDVVNTSEQETVKDIPPIPIKTYQWEEVRREKIKGRYPYTHLTKEPYKGEVNPSEFKMDTLRPSKSSSTLEKSSSGVNIQDVTEKTTSHNKDYLDVSAANEGIIEMADSSNEDNISQYLDRDDDQSITIEQLDVPGSSKEGEKMEVDDAQDTQRAKSEEPKRPRKLSIVSSYSRISLSKLGVMKKLREAKEKLKLPKFSFSKSESKLDIPKKTKKGKKSESESAKKTREYFEPPKKNVTPVYIHIPLKPPPGETDEFSYLEFDDQNRPPSTSKPSSPTGEAPDLGTNGVETQGQQGKEGVQFIILTAPSDDEVLDDHVTPDSPASNGNKKYFDSAKLKDLKTLAKECVDEIPAGTPIDGIIFEDVIQVEYVDEHNNPIGTTERSNFLEVTEENLPKLEKQLSNRSLMQELQHELASSMDSINKINRRNTLKKLKEQHRSRSNEGLQHIESHKERRTQEAPELTTQVIRITADIKQAPDENKTDIKKEEKKEAPEPTAEKKEDPKPQAEKKEDPESTQKTPKVENNKKDALYDEEDGLKLSETAVQMINEELAKEQLPKTNEEELKATARSGSVKKKVSFKRRSKQEDPHGIYEDVRVTSDGKPVDGKEQQVKELKVIDPSQSMSVDEEKSYLDDQIIKAKSLEEDYNKWSKVNDHEYEPINPPVENDVQQQLSSRDYQVTNSSGKNTSSKSSKKSPSNSIRIPLKEDVIVQNEEEPDSADVLTVEEMQERIEDQFFNKQPPPSQQENTPAAATITTNISSTISSGKESEPHESQAKKIQEAFKNQAGKLRTKFKNIKKPNIHMPQRPNLERFKIQKPNISIPKIPDTMRVNLPSFTLPKKSSSVKTRTVKQYSTESNAGDSKKKLFDFSTYPRIFRKKKQTDDLDDDGLDASAATVPRAKKSPKKRSRISSRAKDTQDTEERSPDVIWIPLHSDASMDKEKNDLSSRPRYEDENIDVDDDYLRESQQMNIASAFTASDFSRNRWNHGSFHGHNLNEIANNDGEVRVTDLDNEVERAQTSPEPEMEQEAAPDSRQSDMRSVSSSSDGHRPGVLEKINSDEYFMQVGNYLSAEMREAFQQPTNQLAKLQNDDSFDREFDVSDHSVHETPKRRPIKKPKRKKTPNVSKERIPAYDQESEPEEYPKPFNDQPARPKRKNKHKKKTKDDKPPYQETMFVQDTEFEIMRKAASDNILSSDRLMDHFQNGHFSHEYRQHYENERMQGIEQPNIYISDQYPYEKKEMEYMEDDDDEIHLNGYERNVPEAPPRKQRSLKSLISENDSIVNEINLTNQNFPQQNIEAYRMEHEYIIPTPEEPPIRPVRTRSRTRSQSQATNQPEDETPQTAEPELPCVEEPCVQQVCDYMGYAVIDKNKNREPPLPPPARRKKSNNNTKTEAKFFTVPRPLKDEMPVRPLRNYSTLVPKSQRTASNVAEEEKENVDLGQYIEIEDDEGHSHLQSGDVVQKMKDRPLPAPPRPPRKTKDSDKDIPFKDITHATNLDEEEPFEKKLEETEASVQTEPLSDDFVCEELVQEKGDKIITPTTSKLHPPITEFENIETVTHGALVVSPVADDFQEGPITQFSRSTEKIITIRREVDHEEEDTSDIPEAFQNFQDPEPKIIEKIIERPAQPSQEVEVLKAQKLQVSDLDVDRLMVNELLASKIKVSEIDSDSISVAEINPKSGNLIIGGLELPINFIQDVMEKIAKAQSAIADQAAAQALLAGKDENISKSTVPSKDENVIHNPDEEDGTALPKLDREEQSQLAKHPSEDQIKSNVDRVPSLEEEQQLPVKLEETILPSEDVDRNKLLDESLESKSKLAEDDPELSPNTIKTTIDYLDDLIMEENKLNLVESVERVLQEDLESAIKSKISHAQETATPKQISTDEKSDSVDLEEIPPLVQDTSEEERMIEELKSSSSEQKKTPFEKQPDKPPKRPPRISDVGRLQQSQDEIFIPSQVIENSHNFLLGESTPPPRPPDPEERTYLRSQPPPSFYVLRSPALDDFIDQDIPMPPRRKRQPRPPSRSTSEEALPATPRTRRHRTPEPSIPQLTGQLTKACATAGEKAFKRLVKHITMNVLRNADGKQDLHVMILILLILIAGLILLGNGGNPVVHHYHWEYFNPPKDL